MSAGRGVNVKPAVVRQRMLSVDALRGFDMFWIVGGGGFIAAIIKLFGPGVEQTLLPQLEHVPWDGFVFYDLIYPLFIFLVGVSVVFSLDKYRDRPAWTVYRRVLRRFVMLYLFGLIFYGGFSQPWPNIRLLGVLQRISLCYLFTSLLYYHFRPRSLVALWFAILIGYGALLSFVPVPGTGQTSFSMDSNWARYIDERWLPGRKLDGTWDNNGLLSTVPAVATCLLGLFAGLFLKSEKEDGPRKVAILLGTGVLLLALGWLWSFQLPVIKRIWTSSYVMVAGGYSLAMLGAFHLIVDIWQFRRWAQPFIWFGANAITIYMVAELVDFDGIAERLVGGSIAMAAGPDLALLLKEGVSLAFAVFLVRFLYKKGLFLRV